MIRITTICRFVAAAIAAMIVASCTTVQYQGDTRAPTNKVDVFNSAKEVQRPYTVLGEVKASAQANLIRESRMRERIFAEAKKCGADAVIFLSSEQGLVRDRDYYEESKLRDRPESLSGPNYDRVRILKVQFLVYR